jgi:hypothetical protein
MGRMNAKTPSGVTMLYAGKWAYCPRTERMGKGGLLFDMAADREQTRNLVREHPAVAGRMRRKLRKVMAEIGVPEETVAAVIP